MIYIKCTSDRRQPANRLVGAEQVTMWMNVDIVNALIILSDFVARPFIRRFTVRVTHASFPNLAPVCLLIIKQLRRLGPPLLLLKYFHIFLLLLLHNPIVLLLLYRKVHKSRQSTLPPAIKSLQPQAAFALCTNCNVRFTRTNESSIEFLHQQIKTTRSLNDECKQTNMEKKTQQTQGLCSFTKVTVFCFCHIISISPILIKIYLQTDCIYSLS